MASNDYYQGHPTPGGYGNPWPQQNDTNSGYYGGGQMPVNNYGQQPPYEGQGYQQHGQPFEAPHGGPPPPRLYDQPAYPQPSPQPYQQQTYDHAQQQQPPYREPSPAPPAYEQFGPSQDPYGQQPTQQHLGPSGPQDEADRGFKTNVALAGGAALIGGAMLYHHHKQSSSPQPYGGTMTGQQSGGGFFHHQNNSSHPLAALSDPQKQSICLHLADGGEDDKGVNWDLLSLRHNPSAGPAYRIRYKQHGYAGEVLRGPSFGGHGKDPFWVGAWKARNPRVKFEFPKTARRDEKDKRKWDWHPRDEQWGSDVGMLEDHWLQWNCVNDSRDGREIRFTLRCTDVTDDEKPVVCTVVMQTFFEGSISVPLSVVRDEEQLDEMVVVAAATMDWWRGTFKDEAR